MTDKVNSPTLCLTVAASEKFEQSSSSDPDEPIDQEDEEEKAEASVAEHIKV